MASVVYPKIKEAMLQAGVNLSTGVVKAVLVDAGGAVGQYAYAATHQYLSDVPAASRAKTGGGTPVDATITIDNKTFTNGVFDTLDDTDTFPALNATATTYEAMVIYVEGATEAASPLVAYVDGFAAITPNGGTAVVNWDDTAVGIFTL